MASTNTYAPASAMRSDSTLVFSARPAITMENSITTEIQNIKRTDVDMSVFTVPSDYKVVTMKERMQQTMDSVKANAPARKP